MAGGTQRWTPDTCGCVLVYSWSEAGGEISTSLHAAERKCSLHAHLDGEMHYQAVVVHNRTPLPPEGLEFEPPNDPVFLP